MRIKTFATATAIAAGLAGLGSAQAQMINVVPWDKLKAQPPSDQGVCPPSGYAPPMYAQRVDNDSQAQVYEVASPCHSQELRDAAQILGMGRAAPLGIKVITTARFTATGTFAATLGVPGGETTFEMNFVTNSVRLDIKTPTANGKPAGRIVRVVNDGVAWDETEPGVGNIAAAKGAAEDRTVLLKLTPFGAMLAIAEAEGHAVRTEENGKTVFTGASPYDNVPVKMTLNELKLPEKAEVRYNGHVYAATFSGYTDKWESAYLYVFPAKIVWTQDGKPLADLNITAFRDNPYVVFPRAGAINRAAKQ